MLDEILRMHREDVEATDFRKLADGPACPSQSSPPCPSLLLGAGSLSHPHPGYLQSCFGIACTSCCSAPDFSRVLPGMLTSSVASAHCGPTHHPTLTRAPAVGARWEDPRAEAIGTGDLGRVKRLGGAGEGLAR